MPRLFSAIELPATVRAHLGMIRGQLAGAFWISPENMHITLRFAGHIEPEVADEFADRLDEIDARAFELTICGTGAFGGSKPHVVFAALKPSAALDDLQRAHERAARAAGLAPEARTFHPHVTLARLRNARPQTVARFLEETADLRLPPFQVERFVLMSSRPGSGGGPYAVEVAYALS